MSPAAPAYDHVWRSQVYLTDRLGQRLRVIARGALNNVLIEFDDGHQCVTTSFAFKRIAPVAVEAS